MFSLFHSTVFLLSSLNHLFITSLSIFIITILKYVSYASSKLFSQACCSGVADFCRHIVLAVYVYLFCDGGLGIWNYDA